MKQLDNIPQHIAVIMDGNRRWAREHGLPTIEGHRRVTNAILEPLIEYAADRGVRFMTFWAWSTENWARDKREVEGIMRLFRHVIRDRWERLHKKGVKIRVIGDISKFAPDIRESLEKVVEQTKDNTRITAVFALNYGGRDELLRAIHNLLMYKSTNLQMKNNLSPDLQIWRSLKNNKGEQSWDVTKENLEKFLDTHGVPDPELIIRTGGEQRLSGFLLWQSEYSEFYFPSWYMPEFTPQRLDEVIEEYQKRKRRLGR